MFWPKSMVMVAVPDASAVISIYTEKLTYEYLNSYLQRLLGLQWIPWFNPQMTGELKPDDCLFLMDSFSLH